jgi:hypothetical protein
MNPCLQKRPVVTATMLVIMAATLVGAIPQFEPNVYDELVKNPLAQVKTVYTSYAGISLARTTSFLSSFSSLLIIVIILRSGQKLSSSYHRIIFGMSVADAMGSLAIFCSTWLMPKEMIYKQFEGAVYGNSATCTAQGFLFFSGAMGTFGFNTVLCIYYVCIIRYNFTEEKFRKCAEPILFCLVITIPLLATVPLIPLVPTPYDFVCTGARYPYWCNRGHDGSDGDECSSYGVFDITIRIALVLIYVISTVIIFSSMFLVCWTVYMQERNMDKYLKTIHGNRNTRESKPQHTQTRTIMFQALGYLGAFILCQLFPMINLLKVLRKMVIFQYLHVLLRPLQGLFNLMIFMRHKISNIRRSNNKLTTWQAFCQVFTSKEEPTLFVDNLDILIREQEGDEISVSLVRRSRNITSNEQKSTVSPAEVVSSSGAISYGTEDDNVKSNALDLSYDTRDKFSEDISDPNNKTETSLSTFEENQEVNSSCGISWFSRLSSIGTRDNISLAVSSM